ncbi:unnamed protein product [Musa acuminata subsp. burmannicoides]
MAVIEFFPPPSPIPSATLHPDVHFNICDCYVRRPDQAERVIGTLLGSVSDGVLEIKNSYAVPHNEPADQVCLFQCRISLHSSQFQEIHLDLKMTEAERVGCMAFLWIALYIYIICLSLSMLERDDNFALFYLSSLIRTQLSIVEKLNTAAQIL